MDSSTIDARVLRGAELLDQRVPHWYKRVYLDAFSIANCERCVLGQVFFGYVEGFDELCTNRDTLVRYHFAVDHGFDTEGDGIEDPSEIAYLEKAWTLEIHERLLAS